MMRFVPALALIGLALTACNSANAPSDAAPELQKETEAPPESTETTKTDPPETIRIEPGSQDAAKADKDPQESSSRLAQAGAKNAALKARGIEEIGWEDLMPEGEEEILSQMYQQQMAMLYSAAPIAEGSADDVGVQIGTFNTIAEMNEKKVRIPGYVVPLEAKSEISEFLLVPYPGACLHTPPPPPNQTIFAMMDEPVKLNDVAYAVWIEGTLYTQTQESELADAAYTIEVKSVEAYDW